MGTWEGVAYVQATPFITHSRSGSFGLQRSSPRLHFLLLALRVLDETIPDQPARLKYESQVP